MLLQRRLTALVISLMVAAFATSAPRAAETDSFPKDPAALDAYIREFILKNPQVVREALLSLDREEQAANAKKVLIGFKGDLYQAGSPEIGNADAKVKIVEFFDYNCSYCRATYPKLRAFLKANPDTKIILKDVASFGPDSEAVARIALAAQQQGKFDVLNDALMTMKGKATEARALEFAEKLGLDVARLKKDAQSAATAELLTRTRGLADRINANMTPLFVIGHNGISGVPDDFDAQLAEYVGEIRKSGCDVC